MGMNRNNITIICTVIISLVVISCDSRNEESPVNINVQNIETIVAECLSNDTAIKPDLIITNIYKKEGIPYYYYVEYMNIGAATNVGDFLIKLSSPKGEFPGNSFYRIPVPAPCSVVETGGYTVGLVGIAETESAEITAEIDWEERVSEIDEENNSYTTIVNAPVSVKPVADAGTDQIVTVGETVMLDGSGSSDPENDVLTFRWGIVSQPLGSVATLSDTSLMAPILNPDKGGIYNINLIVNDGLSDSAADSITVTAEALSSCQTNAICSTGNFCEKPEGSCDALGSCVPMPTACSFFFDPVCGCNGVTYSNSCEAAASGVNVLSQGAC